MPRELKEFLWFTLNLQLIKSNKNINSLYEISIPTCSYRMGVPNMGYGVMTISKYKKKKKEKDLFLYYIIFIFIAENGNAFLSILWLHSRYGCLYLYLFFIIIVLLMIFSRFCLNFIFYKLRNSKFLL